MIKKITKLTIITDSYVHKYKYTKPKEQEEVEIKHNQLVWLVLFYLIWNSSHNETRTNHVVVLVIETNGP